MWKKVPTLYKQKSCEVNIWPYDNVILRLSKSNMDLKFVTGVYAYIPSIMFMQTQTCNEKTYKKASKEVYGNDIKGKMLSIGNTFLTKCKVSVHKSIKRVLSLPIRHSNIVILYVPTSLKKKQKTKI